MNIVNKPQTLNHENTIKGAKGIKVKVLFQHVSFLCWFTTLKFIFWIPSLTLHVKYTYVLIANRFYILYIMHSCFLSHKYEQLLLKPHFQNP